MRPVGPKISAQERQVIMQAVAELTQWRHRIDLGAGITTPGREDCVAELARINLPDELGGLRVLDVGCSDGFFSFECERRGADVIGIDSFTSTPFNNGRCGFLIAKEILDARAQLLQQSVFDLNLDEHGQFDLILFLNVLYHLRHPLLALERLFTLLKPGGTLVLKTYLYRDLQIGRWGFDISRRPLMRFFEGDELNRDASNWWAPNRTCLEGMLRATGFVAIQHLSTHGNRTYYRCRS